MAGVVITQPGIITQPATVVHTQPVVLHTAPRSPIREHYNATSSVVLGSFQIVVGVLCIVFTVLATVWQSASSKSGYGYWCTIPIIVTGIIGVIAGKNKLNSTINAYLVMSIISMCAAGLLGLIALIAITHQSIGDIWDWDDHDNYYDDMMYSRRQAMNVCLLIGAILLAGSLIWSTVVAANCCRGSTGHVVGNTTVMTTTTYPQQQVMTYPQAQPMGPPAYGQAQFAHPPPQQPAQYPQPQYAPQQYPQAAPQQYAQAPQYGAPEMEKPPAYNQMYAQ